MSKRTVAVVPVKSFRDSLERLSSSFGSGTRAALAETMFRDVIVALSRAKEVSTVAVVTGDPQARELAAVHEMWLIEQSEDLGHSESVLPVLDACEKQGFDQALIVPIDCPQIDPLEIDDFLRRSDEQDLNLVIVPDHHGTGTNALLLRPPTIFKPSFGAESLQRHIQSAKDADLKYQVEEIASLQVDLDSPQDLILLRKELEDVHGRAQLTVGTLRRLQGIEAKPS